ncbi:MAG: arylesterase [Gammaproteobacteria bacterium]
MVMLLGAVRADATAPGPVLVMGDSLSAGYGIDADAAWPRLLEARLREEGYRHSVINASISGETSAGGARRLPALLDEHTPALVIVALGANDGLRGFDVAEMRRNLAAMLHGARDAGAGVVLVRMRIPPNYGPRYTAAFESVFEDVAAASDTVLAPFMLERFAANREAFQRDGLHPVAAVQDDIVATLWPSIHAALEAAGETPAP